MNNRGFRKACSRKNSNNQSPRRLPLPLKVLQLQQPQVVMSLLICSKLLPRLEEEEVVVDKALGTKALGTKALAREWVLGVPEGKA
jgi:hypothetical protein